LWDYSDVEMKEAKTLYDAGENCFKVSIEDFYHWLSTNYPLFRYNITWSGISNNDVAEELIEYMKFKLGIDPS
jgi:hypothetical protein